MKCGEERTEASSASQHKHQHRQRTAQTTMRIRKKNENDENASKQIGGMAMDGKWKNKKNHNVLKYDENIL